MLSQALVLKYIKRHLKVPWQKLEMTDEDIMEHINEFVLKRKFSKYLPDMRTTIIDTTSGAYQTEKSTEYIIYDEDNMDIINVVEMIPTNELVIFGHPVVGSFSYDALPDWYLRATEARTTWLTSDIGVFSLIFPSRKATFFTIGNPFIILLSDSITSAGE